jgi:hypothetical protein
MQVSNLADLVLLLGLLLFTSFLWTDYVNTDYIYFKCPGYNVKVSYLRHDCIFDF